MTGPVVEVYVRQGHIPMCTNKSRPGHCCLYDEQTRQWFKPDFRPCLRERTTS